MILYMEDMNASPNEAAYRQITVGFLLIESFSLLSYATAIEPLRAANTLAGQVLYRWVHISVGGGSVRASNGTSILSDYKVGQIPPIDRLFVCAGGNPASFRHGPT